MICLSAPVEVKKPSKNSRNNKKVKAENKENPGYVRTVMMSNLNPTAKSFKVRFAPETTDAP